MKPLLFDWEEFPNEGWQKNEYEIDFDSNEHRRYKQWLGVRLYHGGPLEIRASPYRDPDRANDLRCRLGLDFRLASECGGYDFFLEDGTPVRKGSITTDMFLLDHRNRVALRVCWGNDPVRYYAPYAWPSGGAEFEVRTPDRQRAKALKRLLRDTMALGLTYFNLGRDVRGDTVPLRVFMEGFLKGNCRLEDLTPSENPTALYELGALVFDKRVDGEINRWTERTHVVKQLRFVEK